MKRRNGSTIAERIRRLDALISAAPHRVCIVVFPGASGYDIGAVTEALTTANGLIRRECGIGIDLYAVDVVSSVEGTVDLEMGIKIVPTSTISSHTAPVGTLMVSGSHWEPMQAALNDTRLIHWIRATATQSKRVAAMCTGAFLLAKAGLVKKRVTTHWAQCARMRQMFPQLQVEEDNIYTRENNVYSSAGSTAAMDMTLALVEEDLGSKLALDVARRLVMFLKRPGGQSQFSTALLAQSVRSDSFCDLARRIGENLGADLSVERLAEWANMSPRNFARVFLEETGFTPAKFVERARLERARQLIEESSDRLSAISYEAGFESPQKMRRTFERWLGVTPADYARRFGTLVPTRTLQADESAA